jgi:hypothetical protein
VHSHTDADVHCRSHTYHHAGFDGHGYSDGYAHEHTDRYAVFA